MSLRHGSKMARLGASKALSFCAVSRKIKWSSSAQLSCTAGTEASRGCWEVSIRCVRQIRSRALAIATHVRRDWPGFSPGSGLHASYSIQEDPDAHCLSKEVRLGVKELKPDTVNAFALYQNLSPPNIALIRPFLDSHACRQDSLTLFRYQECKKITGILPWRR